MDGSLLRVLVAVVVMLVLEDGGAAADEPPVVRTPHTYFAKLSEVGYPWEPHYLLQRVDCLPMPLRVHYIDEGWLSR